jgi:RNA polymerase sigma-70 factor (ECF subfamily)
VRAVRQLAPGKWACAASGRAAFGRSVDSSSIDQSRLLNNEILPHEAALRGYLRHRFPSLDTDDVVQESYLRFLRARAAGRLAHTLSSTRAYLFTIARHTALTLFHRRRIYSSTPLSELSASRVVSEAPDPAESLAQAERHKLMCQAIASLSDRCGEVMRLAVLRGCANAEIAATLGIAESTVRVHLARGIRQCTEFMQARQPRK